MAIMLISGDSHENATWDSRKLRDSVPFKPVGLQASRMSEQDYLMSLRTAHVKLLHVTLYMAL